MCDRVDDGRGAVKIPEDNLSSLWEFCDIRICDIQAIKITVYLDASGVIKVPPYRAVTLALLYASARCAVGDPFWRESGVYPEDSNGNKQSREHTHTDQLPFKMYAKEGK